MPTPSGLPKKGDHLVHIPSNIILTVVKREGNGSFYRVVAAHEDGHEVVLSELPWMLKHDIFLLEAP